LGMTFVMARSADRVGFPRSILKRRRTAMWDHYKKTFVGTQTVILVVSLAVFLFFGHSLVRVAAFFVVMEWSAVIGATWAARIRAVSQRKAVGLPLEPR